MVVVDDDHGGDDLRRLVESALGDRAHVVMADEPAPGGPAALVVRRTPKPWRVGDAPVLLVADEVDDHLRLALLRGDVQDYVIAPGPEELRTRAGVWLDMRGARAQLQSGLAAAPEVSRTSELPIPPGLADGPPDDMPPSLSRSLFLGIVSHELRTPLATIQLQVDRFARAPELLDDRQRAMVHVIGAACQRLGQLVTTSLEMVRHEEGDIEVGCEKLDPALVVNDVVEEARPRALAKRLALTLTARADVSRRPFEGDPQLLRLIAHQLVDNAIKFTETGAVDVGLHIDGERLVMQVSDTGPGIPPGAHERLFRSFSSMEAPHHKHKPGVGLGLALARQVARALGGHVALVPSATGCTFVATLPGYGKASDVDAVMA